MKIMGLMQRERMAAIEDRRKMFQRKNVGDVYRKNLQYVQPKKNTVLIELENLLLGHKDHDLYEKHKEESNEITPQEQIIIQEMQQDEKNVRAHEYMFKVVNGEDISCISHAQNSVKSEIPADSSIAGHTAYWNEALIEIEIPEPFSKELKINPFADTIFGRSYEELYRASFFKKATQLIQHILKWRRMAIDLEMNRHLR